MTKYVHSSLKSTHASALPQPHDNYRETPSRLDYHSVCIHQSHKVPNSQVSATVKSQKEHDC